MSFPTLNRVARYPAPLRLGIFVLALLLLWLPLAVPIYLLLAHDPNAVTILTMGWMFLAFLCLLRFWGKKVYRQPRLLRRYGLVWTRQNGWDFLKGLGIGLVFTFGLFALEASFGWIELSSPTIVLLPIIAAGLLSAVGIALAEELIFRGWLLDELQRDYAPRTALWTNAIIFALLHFIKPIAEIMRTLVQFPALVLLGLILVWAKWGHRDRLGICIGLHGGLVWGYYILHVGQIVQYSGQVSPWITGINGNPIAGAMGILFLGILAGWARRRASGAGEGGKGMN